MITVVGTGYTGKRILKRIADATGISRSVPTGIDAARIRVVDLDGGSTRIEASEQIVYTVPPGDGNDDDPRLETFLRALARPARRIVYLSTTGVYGDRRGERVTEDDPVDPQTSRARRRAAAERQLETWCGEHGTELVVLRVPGIYGPGRLGIDRLRAREPMLAEADAGPGNRIHVDDLVGVCIRAAEPDAPAGVYNVGDGDHRSATAFSKAIAFELGIEPGPEVDWPTAEDTFSPMRLSFLKESRTIDTTKMTRQLDYAPRYADPTDGIRASLDEDAS
jgi:nucleoside-diphosphate-sugar epimerase